MHLRFLRSPASWLAGACTTTLLFTACPGAGPTPDTPGRFGEITSAVVIVNPTINAGSSTTVTSGPDRGGIPLAVEDRPVVETDPTGLALLEDLPSGTVRLLVDQGEVSLTGVQEKELYDVVVALNGQTAQHVLPPVRYPIGGSVVVVGPEDDLAAAATDDAILLLEPGTFTGNLELRSEGVLIFGAWSPEEGPLSIIEGDVKVLGGANRIRGVKVTGKLTSSANDFSLAFSSVGSADITGNGVTLIRNTFTAGSAKVPSSSAVLVDNSGIP